MVKSQAFILVPISKVSCLAQAFMIVSCTKSSALSCWPISDTAKARKLGSDASSSRLNCAPCGPSCWAFPSTDGTGALSTHTLLFSLIEFIEKIEKTVRDRLILNRGV